MLYRNSWRIIQWSCCENSTNVEKVLVVILIYIYAQTITLHIDTSVQKLSFTGFNIFRYQHFKFFCIENATMYQLSLWSEITPFLSALISLLQMTRHLLTLLTPSLTGLDVPKFKLWPFCSMGAVFAKYPFWFCQWFTLGLESRFTA